MRAPATTRRLPPHLVRQLVRSAEDLRRVGAWEHDLGRRGCSTVCREARCPNRAACYARKEITFLILGPICTRACPFCGVRRGHPAPPDPDEPLRLSRAVGDLGLSRAVITSVTRDDLPDGGASHFSFCCRRIRQDHPALPVELLIPDFAGDPRAVVASASSGATLVGHNIETVPRLYPSLRPGSDYTRSLGVLSTLAAAGVRTKSALMVGLGETRQEVARTLSDLRDAGCREAVVGQYLPPTLRHVPAAEYLPRAAFDEYRRLGYRLGFEKFLAGPLARSSQAATRPDEGDSHA